MSPPSRRLTLRLLLTSAGAVLLAPAVPGARAQGLGDFAAGPPPCRPDEVATPAVPVGPEFKAGAPARASLLAPGVAGETLVLKGTVSGLTCGPIARARLDFWQADARGVYDRAGFSLRGHQFTDANGAYRLETIVPGPHAGRAPRLHVRVQPPGKPAFATQLFFPGHPLNASDPQFRPELVMSMAAGTSPRTATFDIVLDL